MNITINKIEAVIDIIDNHTRKTLSKYRYAHSCRVADFAEQLAKQYCCTYRQQRLCFLAGIAHDMCKELPLKQLRSIAYTDGFMIPSFELTSSELLHGRAAAALLRHKYGIYQKSLLQAVRWHTAGSPKFSAIGKILYIADKIEPGRKGCGDLRQKSSSWSLDYLFIETIGLVFDLLKKKGCKMHPQTKKMYQYAQHRFAAAVSST